ncbi:MAG: protocatechuate 3,4-dioxygenase subunit alpha [Pseudomonadota bacterium]|nr:protocatechuate 3,4-dioxygenase subunit alpha [Pseudomonadota bacterium]
MKKNILQQTPSQTVGPFFAYGLTSEQYGYDYPSVVSPKMIKGNLKGTRIRLSGRVFDGENNPLNDAVLEIFQADPNGNYGTKTNEGIFGFGRSGTGANLDHTYNFETLKPGSNAKTEAPHLNLTLFARGIQNHLYTRIYFPEDKSLFETDHVLKKLNSSLRQRLTARSTEPGHYVFDIYLQGKNETVFFDV